MLGMGHVECSVLTNRNCLCLLTVADEVNLTPRSERMAGKQERRHPGTHWEPQQRTLGLCQWAPRTQVAGQWVTRVSLGDFLIKAIVCAFPKVSVTKAALKVSYLESLGLSTGISKEGISEVTLDSVSNSASYAVSLRILLIGAVARSL